MVDSLRAAVVVRGRCRASLASAGRMRPPGEPDPPVPVAWHLHPFAWEEWAGAVRPRSARRVSNRRALEAGAHDVALTAAFARHESRLPLPRANAGTLVDYAPLARRWACDAAGPAKCAGTRRIATGAGASELARGTSGTQGSTRPSRAPADHRFVGGGQLGQISPSAFMGSVRSRQLPVEVAAVYAADAAHRNGVEQGWAPASARFDAISERMVISRYCVTNGNSLS